MEREVIARLVPGLGDEEVQEFAGYGERIEIEEDGVVIRQGASQDSLYLLLEGELQAQCASPNSRILLGKIPAGETVGEMAMIDPMTASATIKASVPSKLWKIDREAFDRFIDARPTAGCQVLRKLAALMARRVRRSSDQLIRRAEGMYYDWD